MKNMMLGTIATACLLASTAAFAGQTVAHGHYGAPTPSVKQGLLGKANTVPFSIINNLGYQCNVTLTQTGTYPNISETVALGGYYYPNQYSYDNPYWAVYVTLPWNCSPTGDNYTFKVTPDAPTVTLDPSLAQTQGHGVLVHTH